MTRTHELSGPPAMISSRSPGPHPPGFALAFLGTDSCPAARGWRETGLVVHAFRSSQRETEGKSPFWGGGGGGGNCDLCLAALPIEIHGSARFLESPFSDS